MSDPCDLCEERGDLELKSVRGLSPQVYLPCILAGNPRTSPHRSLHLLLQYRRVCRLRNPVALRGTPLRCPPVHPHSPRAFLWPLQAFLRRHFRPVSPRSIQRVHHPVRLFNQALCQHRHPGIHLDGSGQYCACDAVYSGRNGKSSVEDSCDACPAEKYSIDGASSCSPCIGITCDFERELRGEQLVQCKLEHQVSNLIFNATESGQWLNC